MAGCFFSIAAKQRTTVSLAEELHARAQNDISPSLLFGDDAAPDLIDVVSGRVGRAGGCTQGHAAHAINQIESMCGAAVPSVVTAHTTAAAAATTTTTTTTTTV